MRIGFFIKFVSLWPLAEPIELHPFGCEPTELADDNGGMEQDLQSVSLKRAEETLQRRALRSSLGGAQ